MGDKRMDFTKKQKDDVIFLNQRSDPRISAQVEVTVSGPHNFFTGFTQNLSKGGLFVATHQVFGIGTEFDIELTLERKRITVTAKVCWVRENTPFLPEGIEPGMGLSFVRISDEDLASIHEFLNKREPLFYDAE